jgi:4-hydroxybenzoate polyprenyltransferase
VLFRAHTAILETPLAVLGAALALGTVFHIDMLYWILFGVAYHCIGYGMNSYVDWIKGYDQNDPHKQHHPLNTGDITPRAARNAIFGLLIGFIVYALWLGSFSLVAVVGVALMLVAGVTYNYLGKVTEHKYVPIAIVHTMVFVYPYITYTTELIPSLLLGAAAFFIHNVYQIAISGDIKDIEQDESSIIRSMGARVYEEQNGARVIDIGSNVRSIALTLTIVESTLALSIYAIEIETVVFNNVFILPLVVMTIWLLREHFTLTQIQPYDRNTLLSAMARRELAGIWMIAAAFSPHIGAGGFAAIVAVSAVYLLATSRFMWGTWLRPDV